MTARTGRQACDSGIRRGRGRARRRAANDPAPLSAVFVSFVAAAASASPSPSLRWLRALLLGSGVVCVSEFAFVRIASTRDRLADKREDVGPDAGILADGFDGRDDGLERRPAVWAFFPGSVCPVSAVLPDSPHCGFWAIAGLRERTSRISHRVRSLPGRTRSLRSEDVAAGSLARARMAFGAAGPSSSASNEPEGSLGRRSRAGGSGPRDGEAAEWPDRTQTWGKALSSKAHGRLDGDCKSHRAMRAEAD
jgi:hypothetical protein